VPSRGGVPVSWEVRVVRNRYVDSVRLMQVAQGVRARDGVQRCELLAGTAANLELLSGLGVRADAAPTDVVIAVQADGAAAEALEAAERDLVSAAPGADGAGPAAEPPRSLPAAARALAGANVALISLPGEYAVLEAHRALSEGLHVFLFSDHVSTADELALKRRGAERGLLVMGPGCGTAMLGGVGLGFANEVRPGPVGIVAAAGTGAQEAAVLLDAAGTGVSHIVGVGGRDLTADVGGIMFREAMEMLAADDATETLLVVSKPPSPEVVRELASVDARGCRVVGAFVGWEGGEAPFEVHPTLEAGAYAAAGAAPPGTAELEAEVDVLPGRPDGSLLGLYCGGTLAFEAVSILAPLLGRIGGNAGDGGEDGHRILDLGEEEYTQGRPHPMVDLEVRLEMLREAARDDHVGCVLLDVVTGHGSHSDPAGGLADVLEPLARERPVIAHVCGTAADPQDARRQASVLREAGVVVAPTNAAAARLAARALGVAG
jgi:FdrA protein